MSGKNTSQVKERLFNFKGWGGGMSRTIMSQNFMKKSKLNPKDSNIK
jgi:hypothetical protein